MEAVPLDEGGPDAVAPEDMLRTATFAPSRCRRRTVPVMAMTGCCFRHDRLAR
ncbi:MAG: hypothetical protein MZV65_32150 [Chromatiales bacterium]|nr:hypothetical protein [Chromatiales bacterium]